MNKTYIEWHNATFVVIDAEQPAEALLSMIRHYKIAWVVLRLGEKETFYVFKRAELEGLLKNERSNKPAHIVLGLRKENASRAVLPGEKGHAPDRALLDTKTRRKLAHRFVRLERTSVQQFFEWLSNAIQMERAEAETEIPNPAPAWNAAAFAVAPAAVTAFTTFLRTMVDHPDVPGLPVQLAMVHQAWTNALQKQFAAPNASVQAQLDARDYVQATRVAFQQKNPAPAGAAAALSRPAGPAFMPPEFRRDTVGAAALPVYAIHTLIQTIATPAPAVRTTVTDVAKLKKEKRTQSLIIGLLLVVAGYGLQLSTFGGTFTDFSTLFFWAFALDLTVDQIGKVTKKAG
jgi:hypothetical protein